jgi:pimeloyl-ACP methyl ester carboxylesterase
MNSATSKDGTVIAYDQVGQGPKVVLVGGAFNTRSFGPNESLAKELSKNFTVINYDRRGRGDSTDIQPYSTQREVEDAETLIDAVGAPVYVYGISSGAALALDIANALGGKVAKLAVFEAPFVVDSSRKPVPADFSEQLRTMSEQGDQSGAIKYFMTKGVGLPGIFVAMMRLMPAWSKLKAVAPTAAYDAACLHDNGAGKPLDGSQWSSVTMPTLVISGGKSPKWMQSAMPALAKALPNASHRTLAGQMHIVRAEALAPVLVEFFNGK